MEGCQAPVRVVRNPTVRIESPKATLGICILRSSTRATFWRTQLELDRNLRSGSSRCSWPARRARTHRDILAAGILQSPERRVAGFGRRWRELDAPPLADAGRT